MNNKIKHSINKAINFLLISLMLGITLLIVLQVFFRYVLNFPLPWPEEVARICMVWLTFYGCYMAMVENRHISFDLFLNKMDLRRKNKFLLGQNIFNMIFIAVIIKYGFDFSVQFASVRLSYTQIPLGLVYSVFPISGTLMLYQAIMDMIDQVKIIKNKGSI